MEALGRGPTCAVLKEQKRGHVKGTANIWERKTFAQGSCEAVLITFHCLKYSSAISMSQFYQTSKIQIQMPFPPQNLSLSFLSPKFHTTFHISQFLMAIYPLYSVLWLFDYCTCVISPYIILSLNSKKKPKNKSEN